MGIYCSFWFFLGEYIKFRMLCVVCYEGGLSSLGHQIYLWLRYCAHLLENFLGLIEIVQLSDTRRNHCITLQGAKVQIVTNIRNC